MSPLARIGCVVIGRSPSRTGQPATAFSAGAEVGLRALSFVVPLEPLSCRYFVQSAALAVGPMISTAPATATAAKSDLMKRERIDPPEIGEIAVVANRLS